MRIRQVKPQFWSDAKLYGLSRDARLVFIGLWMEADDSGWLRWEPDQIAMDLFPDEDRTERLRVVEDAGKALVERKRLRILRCGHAQIPRLPDHQRLAGSTHQVHTFQREHVERCSTSRARPRGSPRFPGDPRPVRLGQVRLGQNASAHEENGSVTPSERAEAIAENRNILLNGKFAAPRKAAYKTLVRLGANTPEDDAAFATVAPAEPEPEPFDG